MLLLVGVYIYIYIYALPGSVRLCVACFRKEPVRRDSFRFGSGLSAKLIDSVKVRFGN